MVERALGMLETQSLVSTAEAADAMCKAAAVTIESYEKIGDGYTTTFIRGEVGAVQAALQVGAAAARKIGGLVAARVIPRPHLDVERVILHSSSPDS